MVKDDHTNDGDPRMVIIEYLSNRTPDLRAIYFKGTSRIQIFVKQRIGPEVTFSDDQLYDAAKLVVSAFLHQARRQATNSKKDMRVYQAMLRLKKLLDVDV